MQERIRWLSPEPIFHLRIQEILPTCTGFIQKQNHLLGRHGPPDQIGYVQEAQNKE